ncbi:hypothetical protein Q8A67_020032 [Cirrhinus molitorella]|uniref:Uncharacterized protein n=1 Tax=Cirrhinus molitorella TaxID=172907 RepID=A0AA88PMP1_9TELE|nr:hypothetical protein Q8A67_020032 [Cirrhinus molitorella]
MREMSTRVSSISAQLRSAAQTQVKCNTSSIILQEVTSFWRESDFITVKHVHVCPSTSYPSVIYIPADAGSHSSKRISGEHRSISWRSGSRSVSIKASVCLKNCAANKPKWHSSLFLMKFGWKVRGESQN